MSDYLEVADALTTLVNSLEDYLKAVKNHNDKHDSLTEQALYEADMELNDSLKRAKEVL